MISKLKQARINLNLSVEDIARKLNIRRQYIVALEENRLEEIPGSVYVNGYIKMYCKYVGIQYSDLSSPKESEKESVEPIFKNVSSRNRVGIAISLILFLACASWIYVSSEVHQRSNLIEHLEEFTPVNYLAESAKPHNIGLGDDKNKIIEVDYNVNRSQTESE